MPIIGAVLVSDFHYELPGELIAQEPLADRAGSRLLHVKSVAEPGYGLEDRQFREFPNLLRPSDLVVFNNTRVFPARLYGRRGGLRSQAVSARNPAAREFLRGRIEVLLTRQLQQEPNEWECLVRPGRKIGLGEHLFFGRQDELQAEVIGRGSFGERRIRFAPPIQEGSALPDPSASLRAGSRRMQERGIETAEVTLHVGLGTFQPVRSERVEEHRLHSEAYLISEEAAEKINRARRNSRRIVAVGTTTARTLEYAAHRGAGEVCAGSGDANLFIYPGYKFQVVQALLTNFHLPQSTLLMLVCALGGKENVMRAYEHAVRERYRFYSYGDCMFVE